MLVYQISGASQMFHLIVVLSRSFIFLNGFAHFNHFWKLNYPEEKEEKSVINDLPSASKKMRFMMVKDNFFYLLSQLAQSDYLVG